MMFLLAHGEGIPSCLFAFCLTSVDVGHQCSRRVLRSGDPSQPIRHPLRTRRHRRPALGPGQRNNRFGLVGRLSGRKGRPNLLGLTADNSLDLGPKGHGGASIRGADPMPALALPKAQQSASAKALSNYANRVRCRRQCVLLMRSPDQLGDQSGHEGDGLRIGLRVPRKAGCLLMEDLRVTGGPPLNACLCPETDI